MALKVLPSPAGVAQNAQTDAARPKKRRNKPRLVLVDGLADSPKGPKARRPVNSPTGQKEESAALQEEKSVSANPAKKPRKMGLPPSLLDYGLNMKNPMRSCEEAWELVERHIHEIPGSVYAAGLHRADPKNLGDAFSEATCSWFVSALKFDESLGVPYPAFANAEVKRAFPFAGRLRTLFHFSVYDRKWVSRYNKWKAKNPGKPEEAFMKEWGVSAQMLASIKKRIQSLKATWRVVDGHDAFSGNSPEERSDFRAPYIPPSSMQTWGDSLNMHPLAERLHDSAKISERVQSVLDRVLTPKEKEVLLLHMGPMGKGGKSLQAIADMPIWKGGGGTVSRERARQVKEKALEKLTKGRAARELRKLFAELPD